MQGMGDTRVTIPFTIHYSQFTIIKGTTRSTCGCVGRFGWYAAEQQFSPTAWGVFY